MWNTKTHFKNT